MFHVAFESMLRPAVRYVTSGRTPPASSELPAGSQPNDRYGTSGLNWRGAAGPGAGPEPSRNAPRLTASTTAATAASTEVPATQAPRQRRRGPARAGAAAAARELDVHL